MSFLHIMTLDHFDENETILVFSQLNTDAGDQKQFHMNAHK